MSKFALVSRRSSNATRHPSAYSAKTHQPAPAEHSDASSAHSQYGHRFSQIAVTQPPIQREAEDEAVEGMGETDELQMKADSAWTPIQRSAEGDAEAGNDGEEIQMKGEGAPAARPNVPVVAGGGSALPTPVQDKMERSFGHGFADVRIHTGDEAKQVGALAYTRGTNIHFQPGLYDPMSLGGQELLGHELTHVVQQRAGRVDTPQNKSDGFAPINADTALEGEADAMGARAARGEAAHVQGATGGNVQRKVDVVQRWKMPWSKARDTASDASLYGGIPSDQGGLGATIGTTVQHINDAPSAYGSAVDIQSSDMAAGGLGLLGLAAIPGQIAGMGQGIHDMHKGRKTGDAQRGLEGAGGFGANLLGMATTTANTVQGISTLAHASTLAGAVGGVAAPLGLVSGTVGLGKSVYQTATAQHKKNELTELAGGQTGDLADAAGFAADVQRKRRNRGVINTTSNALIAGGSAAAIAGSAGMGAGAAVGAAMAGAGLGVKYGAMATRGIKQAGRDGRERRDEIEARGDKLGFLDRTVGRAADKVFDFNTDKSTAKKEATYTGHTDTILSNKDVGSQIFSGLGANKSDLAKFDTYHELLGKATRTAEEEATMGQLKDRLQERIMSQMKKRE